MVLLVNANEALAAALNAYEEKAGADPWPNDNPGTHHEHCFHQYVLDWLRQNGWDIVPVEKDAAS